MSVPISYLVVVVIWSTTPLGILWSSETVSPTMAVLLRMVISAIIGLFLLRVMGVTLPWHRKAFKLYSFSVVGVFGGMLFSYLSGQYITSGMISLVFGLSPILSGILSHKILGTSKLSFYKKVGMLLAVSGLFLVFYNSIGLEQIAWQGVVYILLAVFLFSLSGVLVKSVNINIHPAATTVGTLCLSIPLFGIAWLLLDGTLPVSNWSQKSLGAIVYLALFGSLLGFFAYYYILQKLSATTVALITMITPIIALLLGYLFNGEALTWQIVLGTAHVVLGLGLYLLADKVFLKKSSYVKVTSI